LVLDNLNTHNETSLHEMYGPKEAKRTENEDRLEIYKTES